MRRRGSTGTRGGKRKKKPVRPTLAYLTTLDRFLKLASQKVLRLDATEFEIPEWRESTGAGLAQTGALIRQARDLFPRLSQSERESVDTAIEALELLRLADSFYRTLRRGSPIRTMLTVLGSLTIAAGDFVSGLPGDGPRFFGGILKAIGRALGDRASQMPDQKIERLERKLDFVMDLAPQADVPSAPEGTKPVSLTQIKREIEDIEKKLHFIMDLRPGQSIPAPPTGTDPVSLKLLKIKLDNLAARLGDVLIGRQIPIEPGQTWSPPHPIKEEIEAIEKKLDFIMDLPEGEAVPSAPPPGTAPVSLTLLKTKLDNLADRLGDVLIGRDIPIEPGQTWSRPHPIKDEIQDIEKKLHFIMDLPADAPIPPPPPPGTAPVSLTEIKKDIEDLEKKLDFIMDLPAGVPIPPPPPAGTTPVSLTQIEKKLDFIMDLRPGEPIPAVPPGVTPVSLTKIDRRLDTVKKIFVAEEGEFAAASASDSRILDVVAPSGQPPPAFDLSGWIDLREMRSGDEVKVKIEVSLAGRSPVLFSEALFSGVQTRALKHFRDFADGVQAVVGTDVRITISQPASADGFGSPVGVGFQFVIESP